jgi:hypothetical protein
VKYGKEDKVVVKNLVGMMALKILYDKQDETIPAQLYCHGSLPLKNNLITKIFDGPKCHIKFLLWALQNVTDYKIDNRIDMSQLNIFTVNGSKKAFPLLLRGLVQLSGRDAHFFGDLNKIKCLWHDNIKFYDLCNFFEDQTLDQLSRSWLKDTLRESITS